MAKMILDSTTRADFANCRAYWYHRHQCNLVAIKPKYALDFGAAMHLGFKAFYTGDDAVAAFREAYQPVDIPEKEKRTVEHGVLILQKYMEQYHTNPFEIVECNGSHLMKISEDVTYAARMDAVIKYLVTNKLYVMEHKTTSRLTYNFFKDFELNVQIDGYIPACRDKFGECEGSLIDVISTKQEVMTDADVEAWLAKGNNRFLKSKKTSSFARDFATRTIEQQNNFGKEVLDIVDNMSFAIENDSYPKNTRACNYYGPCPYQALCLYGKAAIGDYEVSVWDAKTGKEIKSG